MNKKLLFILTLFTSFFAFSQKLDTADHAQRKAFLADYQLINKNYEQYIKSKYPSDIARDLVKSYSVFQTAFKKEVQDRNYYTKSVFNTHIEELVAKLRVSNSNIPSNLKILIAKDNVPNAFMTGDGILVVNMGLFMWMENEDQLMAILGHEIAHNLLHHSIEWQAKGLMANKNSKEKISAIKKSKTGKSEKAFQLFRDLAYTTSIERRKNEIQADSLGYIIYRNHNKKVREYTKALRNLEEFDTISPTVVHKETYRELFDLQQAPFQDKWMKMEDFSAYNYHQFKTKLDKDSLSSHPEIVDRLNFLQTKFHELKGENTKAEEPSEGFLHLKSIAINEIHPNLFHNENYGEGVYVAMQFLQDKRDTTYHSQWLGKYFDKMVEARKTYRLNRYLDTIDPKNQSESYQQFLSFMWNLSLTDLQKIADYYRKG